MIYKLKWIILLFLLTACTHHLPDFNVPDEVNFDGKIYQKVTDNQLDEMRQLLFLPKESEKNRENWQQGILFFLDKNTQGKTLVNRLLLRQEIFRKQSVLAKINIVQDELQSQVIYPPTQRFNDVQIEFSRGRNLSCGFGQIQFSDKQLIHAKKFVKTSWDLIAYSQQIAQLAVKFVNLPWLIQCK